MASSNWLHFKNVKKSELYPTCDLQNVTIAARGVVEDEPELLWGMEDGLIYGLVFEDVTIGNESVTGVDFFHHNEFVFQDFN